MKPDPRVPASAVVWWLRGPLLVLLLASLCLAAGAVWIWQQSLRHDLDQVRGERFRVSLFQLKTTLEAGLRLGNGLADLGAVSAALSEVRQRQPDVLSVDVADASGQVLFSTDPGGPGLRLPPPWVQACLAATQTPWRTPDADGSMQCVGLVNAFGQGAGAVFLRHRTSAQNAPGWVWPQHTGWLLAAGALMLALAAAACARVVWPLAQGTWAWQQAFGTARLPAGDPPESGQPPPPVPLAAQRLASQHAWLDATDAEAERLDRQEAV